MTTAITVRLSGGWTSKCKACGERISWRKRLDGGLETFEADPVPLRIYRDRATQVPVQELDAADLHAAHCDPERRPRPLFDATTGIR